MKKIIILSLCLMLSVCGCSRAVDGQKTEGEPSPELGQENLAAKEPEGEDVLQEILGNMGLSEKVSQMFLARCPEENAVGILESYPLGGYIFFARDFENETPESFRAEAEEYQNASKIPMFLAVDEEGGTVNRVSRYVSFRSEPFGSPQKVYQSGGMEAVREDAKEKSEFLLDLGLNVNLAPVCDVSENTEDFINPRAFGKGAEETGDYVKAVVEEMSEAKIGSVLKHFPGYGSNADTHTGSAYDTRPYEVFVRSDFKPFKEGISAGAGMVLVSHNVVECMDAAFPASLSLKVHKELRATLHFDGIIMTDDLVMDAIGQYTGAENAAVLAVQAGNDMLISSEIETQVEAVIEAVENGTISEERIDESVMRILAYKQELGLLTE